MIGAARPLGRIEWGALAAGLALAMLLMWPLRGYQTDDTFIHLQYARHLAEGKGLVFNVGERVYGGTSPLWAALLAGAIALGLDGLAAARALGAIATLASIVLVFVLLRRTVTTPALRAAGTLAWSAHAWMLRWSTSGMETPLAVALTLAGFVALTAGGTWGARPARTGILWALVALVRPEAMVLLLLWGLGLLIEARRGGGFGRLARAALPALAIFGGWLTFARAYYGTFWPETLAAKAAGGAGLAYHAGNLWRQARIVGATDGLLVALLVLALLRTGRAGLGAVSLPHLLPWIWVTTLPLLYAVRGVPVLSRYLVPLLPVLAWLAWQAAERWWVGEAGDPARRQRAAWLAAAVAAGVLVQNLAVYRSQVVPHVRTFSPALEQSLVEWGRWFDRHAAADAVIATPDIGAIGYYGRRRVVDLAGLVTPAMIGPLTRHEPEVVIADFEFAAFSRPDFLVDRAPERNHLLTASRYGRCLTPLGEANVPNLGVTRQEPVVYTFYRIDWSVFDSLRAGR